MKRFLLAIFLWQMIMAIFPYRALADDSIEWGGCRLFGKSEWNLNSTRPKQTSKTKPKGFQTFRFDCCCFQAR